MSKSNIDHLFGLLGKKLGHSFSAGFFTQKFEKDELDNCQYVNFEIPTIDDFPALWLRYPQLRGMNVTIPYKEVVISFLDSVDSLARRVGAVNTIVRDNGKLIGFNTDLIGFHASIQNLINGKEINGALILGSGGASKAVAFVFDCMQINYLIVSRNPKFNQISYPEIDQKILEKYPMIINTTPLGTFPKIEECPPIPYTKLGPHNYLFDLIYNPEKSLFLQRGDKMGSVCKNGYEMLILQAEAAWNIWKQFYTFTHD